MAGDLQLDVKYALLLSSRLERFKVKSTQPYKLNFRCPLCGDSQKSATLCRGWLTQSKHGGLRFKCFNCNAQVGKTNSFYDFIRYIDPLMFKDYVTERYIGNTRSVAGPDIPPKIKEPPKFETSPLRKIKKLSQLAHDHPAKKYIESRQIPSNKHYLIYYAPKFKSWINSIIPNMFPTDKDGKIKKEEPRLILPFFDKDKKLFGLSARGFDPNGLRYITIMFDETKPKIFGLERVDFHKPYLLVEGAFDSLFLENAIAMAGADGNLNGLERIENAVIVYDNEPRNAEIHKGMEKIIRAGAQICIWPKSLKEKDINAMVLAGVNNVPQIIRENTFKGLEATLRLNDWKRT